MPFKSWRRMFWMLKPIQGMKPIGNDINDDE